MSTSKQIYQSLQDLMTGLGFTEHHNPIAFTDVAETVADKLFRISPEAAIPVKSATCTSYQRLFAIVVRYRVGNFSQPAVLRDSLLPSEEAVIDALFGLQEVSAIGISYEVDEQQTYLDQRFEVTIDFDRATP